MSISGSGPSGGSCGSRPMVARAGRAKLPCSTAMSPAMARNRVDFPVPLRPTSPTRAPSGICTVACSIRSRPATRSETSSITSIGLNERIAGACESHHSPLRYLFPRVARMERSEIRGGGPHFASLNAGYRTRLPASARLLPISDWTTRIACKDRINRTGEDMCVAGCEAKVRAALSRRSFFTGAAATGFAVAAAPAPAAETRSFSKVVDLTHTMSAEFPTFMGKPGIEMQREFDFKKDRFNLFWWHIVEHAGTHLDAPIHFSEAGLSADKLPVEQLVVPLAVVNVVYQAEQHADYQLSREDLAKWEAKYGRLPSGCFLAMHFGRCALASAYT